jgi:hypothetical protein
MLIAFARIYDTIDALSRGKYFSTVDLKAGS